MRPENGEAASNASAAESTARGGGRSLRSTLLLWLLLPLAVILPLRDWFAHELMLQHTRQAFDQALINNAEALAALVSHSDGQMRVEISPRLDTTLRMDRVDRVFYVVLDEQGRAIAGDPGLAAMPVSVAPGGWRLVDTSMEGAPIRMAVRGLECGTRNCQVRMAETRNKREQLNAQVLRGGLALIFGVVVLLAGVVWWVIVKALRPLQALRLQMASRTLDDLPPLDPGRVPAEVYPLVQAINELFERLRAAAQAQQAFIADAAHQLRTPLTALRTETELALLEPHPGELRPTLNRLHNAAERAARVADQLLALVRTEAAVHQRRRNEVFDLKVLAQQAAQDWVPRALQRGVDLGFQLESARVQGRSYLVRELLANLIHNALEYTPPHAGERARVTVRTRVEPEGFAVLEVEDNGPGIPEEEHELVFERFHRGAGAPGAGSGLGLAIVRDIALAHGARVSLAAADDDGRGLKVKVVWRIAGSKAAQ